MRSIWYPTERHICIYDLRSTDITNHKTITIIQKKIHFIMKVGEDRIFMLMSCWGGICFNLKSIAEILRFPLKSIVTQILNSKKVNEMLFSNFVGILYFKSWRQISRKIDFRFRNKKSRRSNISSNGTSICRFVEKFPFDNEISTIVQNIPISDFVPKNDQLKKKYEKNWFFKELKKYSRICWFQENFYTVAEPSGASTKD